MTMFLATKLYGSLDENLGCFHILVIISNVTLNICIVCVCVREIFIIVKYIPRRKNYWVIRKLRLSFLETARLFSTATALFYITNNSR